VSDNPRVDVRNVLPDSRARITRGVVGVRGTNYIPIYCANCGTPGGGVSAENCTFAFWLCDPCFEKWGHIAGTYAVPDEVFWEKVKNAQLETYGHILDLNEIAKEAANPESIIAKLIREAPQGR
jgi:hypothetical protein